MTALSLIVILLSNIFAFIDSTYRSRRKEKKLRKTFLLFFILIYLSSFAFGEENKFQLSISGGLNNIYKYGSEDDYVMGENDFPVTPSHTAASFGASLAYFFTNNIGIELDGKYTLASEVTLQDPSDQDTLETHTSKHCSITLNILYQFSKGNFRPYIILGGGIDKVLAKDETYTSEYGYEIEVLATEKTLDPLAQVGGGIHLFLNPSLGARFDVRYVLIFDDPNNVKSLYASVGAFLRF